MPTTIGRYQVRALLGQGTFGAVYRAYDPKLDRDVALKVLKAEMTASPQAVQRFLREARAAAKLRHAHIVTVFDADRAGKHYYIVSAFIQGRTLASAVVEGGVDPRQAAEWTAQLASALGHAHTQGLVHRDVKPANTLLDKEDMFHLMDFGLAGWIQEEGSRLTQAGAVMGTPHYMAPEQIRGDTAAVGPRSDLYSAGVVLYELLTGLVPFQGCPMAALPYRILNVTPPPPSQHRPGMDAALEAICLKAMAKDPTERYPSGAELAAALLGWTPTGLPLAEPMAPTQSAEAPPSVWSKMTILPPSARPGASTTSPPPPKSRSRPASPRKPVGPPVKNHRSSSGGLFSLLGLGTLVLLVAAACTGAAFLHFLSHTSPSTEPLPVPKPTMAPIVETRSPVRLTAPFTAVAAKQSQQAWADFLGLPVVQEADLGGGVKMKLTLLPPGAFTMGSPAGEAERLTDEGPQHPVEITQAFYLGVYPVTQAEYQKVMGENPSYFSAGGGGKGKVADLDTTRFPVEGVLGGNALAYCAKLSALESEKQKGRTYRLPTEAEWEYACRAGTNTAYSFGDDPRLLDDYAWYFGNSGNFTHAVGGKKPNVWGLYDMHGNVWQWCADWYDEDSYKNSPVKDPQGPDKGDLRVLRGGSWGNFGRSCRAAYRFRFDPGVRVYVGFRVVCAARRTPGPNPAARLLAAPH